MTTEPGFEDVLEGEAVAEPTTALQNYPSGQPEFDPGDIFIPNLRLAQGLTPEVQQGEAKPGQWLILGFPPEEEVTVVPLLYSKVYEHVDPEDKTKSIPCPDGEACTLREWTGEKDERQPPACGKVYRYVVYSVTHNVLATIRFRRSGERAGRIFNTTVARAGLGNAALTLKAVPSTGKNGAFFVPGVTPTTVPASVLDEAAKRLAQGV